MALVTHGVIVNTLLQAVDLLLVTQDIGDQHRHLHCRLNIIDPALLGALL